MKASDWTIPIVEVPFASGAERVKDLNFLKNGITPVMTAPTQNGGTVFTRAHLNAIGYFATLGAFLDRIGYPYGVQRSPTDDFNGYPKGAILITEDDDYVREYVSQIDDNTHPLPTEAADGTYEGDEYWKPTLPAITDFYPNFSTNVQKASFNIEGKGVENYIPDEDGWYQLSLRFTGGYWPREATLDNELGASTCAIMVGDAEVCRLDGRFAIPTQYSNEIKPIPKVTALVPLHKGEKIACKYTLPIGEYLEAQIRITRWGFSKYDNSTGE